MYQLPFSSIKTVFVKLLRIDQFEHIINNIDSISVIQTIGK
jgi:hypothetical protein